MRARVGGVHTVHVVAFLAGYHLQGKLVVVTQKNCPLAVLGYLRRLLHDLDYKMAILLRNCHIDARHQREVVGHMTFVAFAEVLTHVLRPLVGFGQQQPVLVVCINLCAELADDSVSLGQILIAGAFAYAEVGYGIETEPVHPDVQPEAHDAENCLQHLWIIEIEIWLMAEKKCQ